MTDAKTPITDIFREMIKLGYIEPVARMEEMRLPGEYAYVPSFTSYGTPDAPTVVGVHRDAELEHRSQGTDDSPSNSK